MGGGAASGLLLLGAAGLLAIHALAALVFRVGPYADGAWFDFALAVGRPFALVWRNYPARLTHYLIQYLPAQLLLRAGAPLGAALFLAHAIWQFAPLASLWLCWRLPPPHTRALALAPAGYFVLAGLLTWAFPTEIWMLAAFAWPAFFALAYGRGRGAAALGAVLSIGVLLSYEAGVVLLPLLLWAAFGRKDEDGRPMRRAVMIGAVAGLAILGAAMALMKPSPQIAADLKSNAAMLLNPFAALTAPAVRKEALLVLLGLVLAPAASGPPWLRPVALGVLVAAGLLVALANFGDFAVSHYLARSVCLGVLALAMLAMLWLRFRPPASPPSMALRRMILAAAVLMAAAVTVENLRFALVWRDHVQAIVAATDCARAPTPCTPGNVVGLPAAQDRSTARWGWGLPFRSLMLAPDLRQARLVRDGQNYASPLDCASAKGLTWQGQRPPALQSLAAGICGTGPKLWP
jgi:hypothetical protein